jgi:fluoride ion exporter CrcB/FEX
MWQWGGDSRIECCGALKLDDDTGDDNTLPWNGNEDGNDTTTQPPARESRRRRRQSDQHEEKHLEEPECHSHSHDCHSWPNSIPSSSKQQSSRSREAELKNIELCHKDSILTCLREVGTNVLTIQNPQQILRPSFTDTETILEDDNHQDMEGGPCDEDGHPHNCRHSSHSSHQGREQECHKRKRQQRNRDLIRGFQFQARFASYAVIGESLRICLARLFGGECLQETTPWLHAVVTKYNFCVTSNQGALFLDLPANMLGCFVMGVMQPCKDLDVSDNPDGLAFLPDDHWFHSWKDTHYAVRSGFCSSLTSFASWNTQMVTMMFGVGITNDNGISSQFVSALFGYVMGMELAVASYVLGRWVAVWFYRFSNPLTRPADDETVTQARMSNRTLPDIERQFLGLRLSKEDLTWAWSKFPCLEYLERWRQSTEGVRTGRGNIFRPVFEKIEESILVHNNPVSHDEVKLASAMEWDVDALVRWNVNKESYQTDDMVYLWVAKKKQERIYVQRCLAAMPYVICTSIVAMFVWLDVTGVADTTAYRAMWMSALAAPLGALVRCGFSFMNGMLPHPWHWFPLGTFVSNMTGSIISISAVALSLNLKPDSDPWNALVLFAVKTGFAGSLSTVGTFVVEGHKLQTVQYPFHVRGLCYMGGSVAVAGLLSALLFGTIYNSR